MFIRFLTAALAIATVLGLSSCGGSGGSAPATGEVAVILTDGPTDQYEQILVSMTAMTLIGPGGHVELYNGPEITFDLLAMSEWADLAFTTKVRAGSYNKIRLELSKVELVDLATNRVERLNKLPANGKIDLNPRGPIDVSPEYTTVIKLDMDAKRSFQVVETGNDNLKLRPVIFVDVYRDTIFLQDRLVRLFGVVEADSITESPDDSFRLCELQFVAQSNGPELGDADDCVRVRASGETGIFDAQGEAVDFTAIGDRTLLTAVGFITEAEDTEAFLGLNSVVIEIGDRQADGWQTLQGSAIDDSSECGGLDLCFTFERSDTDPTIPLSTRMRPDTKVYRADGVQLDRTDVTAGDSGSIDAVSVDSELQAALVVLGTDVGSGILTGSLEDVSGSDPYVLSVMNDSGGLFNVCADPETSVILHLLFELFMCA